MIKKCYSSLYSSFNSHDSLLISLCHYLVSGVSFCYSLHICWYHWYSITIAHLWQDDNR